MASAALLLIGLLATGGAYAAFTTSATAETGESVVKLVEEGEALFVANCASCHGLEAEGTDNAPTLIGVGAAAVDFQVGTGRMPMAVSGPQAEEKPPQFTDEQVAALATYVASLGPGPGIPDERYLDGDGDLAKGAELFRINCAMCHNVAGAGGALTEGKFAPPLGDVSAKHVYEAMVTGPAEHAGLQRLQHLARRQARRSSRTSSSSKRTPRPADSTSATSVPSSEGLFVWIFALGAIVGITVWLTAKSN